MAQTRRFDRPQTLVDVAARSDSLAAFGANLRDWQHFIERGGIAGRRQLSACIAQPPRRLKDRFDGGDIADAYLAAYAEWLADQADIERPDWSSDPTRIADRPWFATPLRGYLLVVSPAAFRQRQLFTVPDNIFTPKAGKPSSAELA